MSRGTAVPTPYNEVTFKCTQVTTGAPAIAYTLGNTFGQQLVTTPIVPTRTGTGVYVFTLTGFFTANKTVAWAVPNASTRIVYVAYTSADAITLTWFDAATPSAADSGGFDLVIRVYD